MIIKQVSMDHKNMSSEMKIHDYHRIPEIGSECKMNHYIDKFECSFGS